MARGLGGRRKDAVEAQIHGLRGVMVGPGARGGQDDFCAGCVLPPKKWQRFGEVRIVNLGKSAGAEFERSLDSGHELFLGVGVS